MIAMAVLQLADDARLQLMGIDPANTSASYRFPTLEPQLAKHEYVEHLSVGQRCPQL